jgi:hypothetical protein
MEYYTDSITDIVSFGKLPTFWKALIVIGFIATFVFIVLLIIAISLMFESKVPKKLDLDEFDDFLNEFENGTAKEEPDYPDLPAIKDLQGNVLRNLLQIEVL